MILGMSIVFVFLITLVIMMSVSSAIITRLAPTAGAPTTATTGASGAGVSHAGTPTTPAPDAPGTASPRIAAALAAVARHHHATKTTHTTRSTPS
jgi:sodium pump decarboxylase gamma subunit